MLGSCNTANYNSAADWNGLDGNLTTVGNNGKSSYYGTYDQTGNINELVDTNNGNWKIFRGGSFLSTSGQLDKHYFDTNILDIKRSDLGFRIAKTANDLDSSNYVLVNNSNNSNDSNSLGSVSYEYQIKKYPVTNNEYTEFLNAVSTSSNGLDLWISQMGDTTQRGGINRSGSSPSYTYNVKTNMGDKPVNFINWFNIARYINWLHNNKPSGVPGPNTTEDGVYTLTNFIIAGSAKPSRNNTNSYWLTNENEWYKAAYYDATKGGGGYWNYATKSDDLPDSVTSDVTGLANGTTNSNNCITPTPTPTTTTSPTVTPSVSLTQTPSTTPTISISPTKTPTLSVSVSPTTTPSVTATRTPTKTIQSTPTVTPTNTVTRTPTSSITPTPTSSVTPSITATITPTPSKSKAPSVPIGELIYQNNVYTNDTIQVIYKGFHLVGKLESNVATVYEAPNVSPTKTPGNTPTPTPTISISVTPTTTVSITPSQSLSTTPTITPTISLSPSLSNSPTPTMTNSNTPTNTITSTPTISITPSNTTTVTPTNTATITPTVSVSLTATPTPTITPSTPPDTNILAIAHNSDKSAKSLDGGATWSINNMPSSQYWTSITKDNTKYVACAYNHTNIYISNNGLTWTPYSLSNLTSSNNLWMNLMYGNNIFVMTPNSSAVAARSVDGMSWTETYLPSFANWKGGSYGNNIFLTVAESSSVAATSSDGNTWTLRSIPLSRRWLNVEYLNNNFIVISDNTNNIAYTADGVTWNTSTLPSTNDWYAVAYGNNTYVILAYDGSTAYSSDLINWQSSSIIGGGWKSILYKDKFIALGTNLAYTSINGITWTQRTIGNYQWFDMI